MNIKTSKYKVNMHGGNILSSFNSPSIVHQSTPSFKVYPPCAVTLSWWCGLRTSLNRIAMLAGVFILLLGPPKSDMLKDRGQTK